MSIFLCHECDNLKDSDDGCEVLDDGISLICVDCVQDFEEAEDRRRDNPLSPDFRRLGQ